MTTVSLVWKERAQKAEAKLAQLQQSAAKGLDEIIGLRQQLASAQAALLRLRHAAKSLLDEDMCEGRRTIQQDGSEPEKAVAAELAKQPTDALRSFVLGLLPKRLPAEAFIMCPTEAREYNACIRDMEANLDKALEAK